MTLLCRPRGPLPGVRHSRPPFTSVILADSVAHPSRPRFTADYLAPSQGLLTGAKTEQDAEVLALEELIARRAIRHLVHGLVEPTVNDTQRILDLAASRRASLRAVEQQSGRSGADSVNDPEPTTPAPVVIDISVFQVGEA